MNEMKSKTGGKVFMKKLLLTSLVAFGGCKQLLKHVQEYQELKEFKRNHAPATPTITPTPTIGEAPTIHSVPGNRCAPHVPEVPCTTAKFGDGKGGTLFKRSDTNPKNFAFLLPGNIRTFESVEVCSEKKCEKLPFAGCANPDGIGLRGHYKGGLSLNPKAKWRVKFGECELAIANNERTD